MENSKTYTAKSSAVRAAKRMGLTIGEDVTVLETESGVWILEMKLPEVKAAKQTPIAYIDGEPTKLSRRGSSTVDGPCNFVWEICEQMKGAKRKEVIEKCVEEGVAYYTARTQYQQWLTASRKSDKK